VKARSSEECGIPFVKLTRESKLFWSAFAACQAIGVILPGFGSVHLNIVPLLVSAVLLVPGSMIVAMFSGFESLPPVLQFASAVVINLFAWYVVGKLTMLM
jgi:hypothetical protein